MSTRLEDEIAKNDVLEYEKEDERNQHLRYKKIYLDNLAELRQIKKEQRYLSKKYIAFLIYKGWTQTRNGAYLEEIEVNKGRIRE